MNLTKLTVAVTAAFAGAMLMAPAQAAEPAKSSPAATTGATKKLDAITGATKKRESASGAIKLANNPEGQRLLREMVRDFIFTGDTVFDGQKIPGGRVMVAMGTADQNVPEVITAELTPDYDEATGDMVFYGTTAKDSGKILRASRSGTGISVAWVKQLRPNEHRDYGWNYYDSYGISFLGDLKVHRSSDLNGDEAHDRPVLDALDKIMSRSLPTIKAWGMVWKFDPKLKGDDLRKARDFEIRDFMSYEDVYVVKPRSMIVINYFARPLMINPNNAFVYGAYKLNSNAKGFNLKKSAGYKAALRDTNCAVVMTEPERSRYNFFDGRYPKSSPKNLLNRLAAYKNKAIFGTEKPAANAKPTEEGMKLIGSYAMNRGSVKGLADTGGDFSKAGASNLMTKEQVEKAVAENQGKKKSYHWEDTTKRANMPDRFMVTYTGRDSNGRPYRTDIPNWSRYFVSQPNNVCGIATRSTIEFK